METEALVTQAENDWLMTFKREKKNNPQKLKSCRLKKKMIQVMKRVLDLILNLAQNIEDFLITNI